jgi:translation initiation factor 5A
MSDNEEPTFETADAGSSLTYPTSVGSLRKGGHAMIKEHPCKIVDISTSKTGKHGSAKANYTGIDIFTGKKYEDSNPTSANIDVPRVVRNEYQLLNVDGARVSVLTDSGETKEDLNLPKDTEGNEDETAKKIKQLFDEGKNVVVSVISSIGLEKIIEAKEYNN